MGLGRLAGLDFRREPQARRDRLPRQSHQDLPDPPDLQVLLSESRNLRLGRQVLQGLQNPRDRHAPLARQGQCPDRPDRPDHPGHRSRQIHRVRRALLLIHLVRPAHRYLLGLLAHPVRPAEVRRLALL
jgi:hypothetical protein